MATQHANHHHLAAFLFVSLLLISSSTPSSSRPLNLALPSDRVVAPPAEEEEPTGHVSACGHKRVVGKLPLPGTRLGGGKYGSLVLNMLPKGPVPPSGPSKGTNNLNN